MALRSVREKTVVLTGTFPGLTREQASELLVSAGALVSEAVSAKTELLFAGEGAGSKVEKARALGVPILGTSDLFEVFNTLHPRVKTAPCNPCFEDLLAKGRLARGFVNLDFQKFYFPRHTPRHPAAARELHFLEWIFPEKAQKANPEQPWEPFYDGDRELLVPRLAANNARLLEQCPELPETARWCVVTAEGCYRLVLQDEPTGSVLFVMTSANDLKAGDTLEMPDPDRALHPGRYMSKNVWFEDCNDGGQWVLGVGSEVCLLYVDGPGDVLSSRWRCSRKVWARLWDDAFGARTVRLKSAAKARAPRAAAAKAKAKTKVTAKSKK